MRHALPSLLEALRTRFGFAPIVAFELEWYAFPAGREDVLDAMHKSVQAKAAQQKLGITEITREKGNGQYEAAFNKTHDVFALLDAIDRLKLLLVQEAAVYGLGITFAAKPFPDDYGSALQAHLSLVDAQAERQFWKKGETLSPALSAALGGLMECLAESVLVICPGNASYQRYVAGKDAPLTRSWGGNNRTVALRLPLKNGPYTQIEYRLAGADTDPATVLAVVLAGVLHGLETNPDPGPQMHGIAYDPQYNLPRLPDCYAAALLAYNEGHIVKKWLGGADSAAG